MTLLFALVSTPAVVFFLCRISRFTRVADLFTRTQGLTFVLNIPSVGCRKASSFAHYLELLIMFKLDVTLDFNKLGVCLHNLQVHVKLGGKVASYFLI